MRGNLTVLSVLGLFLIGAIWISIWAPEIAARQRARDTRSWAGTAERAPTPPWQASADALARLEDVLRDGSPPKAPKAVSADKDRLAAFKDEVKAFKDDVVAERDKAKKEHATLMAKYEARGKELYATYCAHCHGKDGEADGEAAAWLPVQPRHLKKGKYRFRTTPGDVFPRDEDLYTTVSTGSMGSPMPGFAGLIDPTSPENDVEGRWALVAHLKTLSAMWTDPEKAEKFAKPTLPMETVLGPEPKDLAQMAKAKGRELFQAACANCHGPEGRGDGNSASTQKDDSGAEEVAIWPRNFHRPWQFKRGRNVKDIAYTIATGIHGTGMPAHVKFDPGKYDGSMLKRDEVWTVARYVYDLSARQAPFTPPKHVDPGKHLGAADVELVVRERAWRYEVRSQVVNNGVRELRWDPLDTISVEQGQVVRISFLAFDNGVGNGQGLAIAGLEDQVHLVGITTDMGPVRATFKAASLGRYAFYNPVQSAPGEVLARMTGTLVVAPPKEDK